MEIISHRGYWKTVSEKNTKAAFERSFSLGLGTETDIRDFAGELVISHDIPNENCMKVDTFFELYTSKATSHPSLALNIKADGLQEGIKKKLNFYDIKNYFFFDMSIPDTMGYYKNGLNVFLRESEYEKPSCQLLPQTNGIWLDSFVQDLWYDKELINKYLENNRIIAIVSSELHKRNPKDLWNFLKQNNFHKCDRIILCTDIPEDAEAFFKV